MGKDVIVACDFAGAEEVYEFLDLYKDEKPFVKIGMELFYSSGPEIVKRIKERGHKIFLDLKCHDIPNTVRKTMGVIGAMGVDICNVHAAGAIEMMRAAMDGLTEGARIAGYKERTLLIAVTQLTSTDEETMKKEILIERPLDEVVMSYALNAKTAGLDGVVCSAMEASKVHETCGTEFITVTPGIRFADGEKGDQKRVMTPEAAGKAGADYIVVGRAITGEDDPVSAYRRCVKEFVG